ncbi:uncharacterized protein LOC135345698 isoform X2 [Halichondria panicea]|uniref:uncharacterized protein LOC135345698 isoform X2 n=1 Tax=Halichondria panicea TaxID=6063 RepID=UPI00312B6DD2
MRGVLCLLLATTITAGYCSSSLQCQEYKLNNSQRYYKINCEAPTSRYDTLELLFDDVLQKRSTQGKYPSPAVVTKVMRTNPEPNLLVLESILKLEINYSNKIEVVAWKFQNETDQPLLQDFRRVLNYTTLLFPTISPQPTNDSCDEINQDKRLNVSVALSGTTPNCQAYQIGQNNGSAYVQVECTVGPLARYDVLHLLYNNKIVASPESYTITRFSNTTDAGQYSSHGLITILAINNNTLVPVCALEKKMHQQEQKQTCINLNLTDSLNIGLGTGLSIVLVLIVILLLLGGVILFYIWWRKKSKRKLDLDIEANSSFTGLTLRTDHTTIVDS